MVTAAVSGQAKMVATSATLVNQIGQRNPDLAYEPKFVIRTFDLAIGLRKNEPELKAKLDEWVAVKSQERQAQRDLPALPRLRPAGRDAAVRTNAQLIVRKWTRIMVNPRR